MRYTKHTYYLIVLVLLFTSFFTTMAQSEPEGHDLLLYRHHIPEGMSLLIPEYTDLEYGQSEPILAADGNEARPQIDNLVVTDGSFRISLLGYNAADVMTRDELRQILIDNFFSNGYEERETDSGRILVGEFQESRAFSGVTWIYEYDQHDSLLVVSMSFSYQMVPFDEETRQTILESVEYDPASPVLENDIYMNGGLIASIPSYLSLDHNPRQGLLLVRHILDRVPSELLITRAFTATLPDEIDPDDLIAVADFDRANTVYSEVFYEIQVGDETVIHVSPSDDYISNRDRFDEITHGFVRRLNEATFISAGLEYFKVEEAGETDLVDDAPAIIASIRSTTPSEVDCRMQFAEELTIHVDPTLSSDVLETVPAETDIQIVAIQLAREGNYDPFPPRRFSSAREQFYIIWQTDNGWIFPEAWSIAEDGFCYRVPIESLAE